MNANQPNEGKQKIIYDWGRFVGGCIFLTGGICLIAWRLWPFEKIWTNLEAFNWKKIAWCFGWVAIGFAFNAFKAAQKKPAPKTHAWPLYLWFYFPILCLISFVAYCSIDVFTVDKPSLFHPLAAALSLALGYHADRVAQDISAILPNS